MVRRSLKSGTRRSRHLLITEIGGFTAIKHRYQDLERERYGRSFQFEQIEQDEPEEGEVEPDDRTQRHRIEDVLHVWHGLLATAQDKFGPEEDVSLLLRLLADMPDVLDESFGTQWPIGTLDDRFHESCQLS